MPVCCQNIDNMEKFSDSMFITKSNLSSNLFNQKEIEKLIIQINETETRFSTSNSQDKVKVLDCKKIVEKAQFKLKSHFKTNL